MAGAADDRVRVAVLELLQWKEGLAQEPSLLAVLRSLLLDSLTPRRGDAGQQTPGDSDAEGDVDSDR